MTRIALIPGDGVGPEVMAQAAKLIEAINKACSLQLDVTEFDLSAEHFLQTGIALPQGVVDTISEEMDGILLGPLGDPRVTDDEHSRSVLKGLIQRLDLFAGIRRIRLLSEDLCPLSGKTEKDIDFVLVWEALGGVYTNVGGTTEEGTEHEIVIEQEVMDRRRVERVVRFAFDYSVENGRSRVVVVRKSRDYAHSHNLWTRTFREVREDYPDVSASHVGIESLIQQIIESPEQFDVIVTNHMFGSLISSLGTVLHGGQGLAASSLVCPGKIGLFRPLHSSSTKYTGKNYANPLAAMISVQALMEFKGYPKVSVAIEESIRKALKSGWVSRDLGGSMGTDEIGDYVCSAFMDTVA